MILPEHSSDKTPVTLGEIEAVLPLKTWWAILFVLPVSKQLIAFLVNRTELHPNTITAMGLFFRLITALCFFLGSTTTLTAGAIAYIIAYVLDCTDGAVARLTGKKSEFGRYLDHLSDLLGDILILLTLAWSQNLITTPLVWAMAVMHLSECYISYLTGYALACHHGTLANFVIFRWFNRYRNFFFRRNIKSFFSFPDYTALVFVIFPLADKAELGLQIGFPVLMVVCVYTIISTFVSIHTDTNIFP